MAAEAVVRFRLGAAYGLAAASAVSCCASLGYILSARKEVDRLEAKVTCLETWYKCELKLIRYSYDVEHLKKTLERVAAVRKSLESHESFVGLVTLLMMLANVPKHPKPPTS